MTKHGGKRQGAGRPPLNVQKLNITLPQEQIDWLKATGNASDKIRSIVEDKMDEEDKARTRISEMEFTSEQEEFIWADWPNWDEHIDWLLIANKQEIEEWIAAGQ